MCIYAKLISLLMLQSITEEKLIFTYYMSGTNHDLNMAVTLINNRGTRNAMNPEWYSYIYQGGVLK